MNLSMMPHHPLSRYGVTHDAPAHTATHEERPTLQRSAQGKRQLKRLHWVMFIASLLLLGNMLATVTGLSNPLYDYFHPATSPDTVNDSAIPELPAADIKAAVRPTH